MLIRISARKLFQDSCNVPFYMLSSVLQPPSPVTAGLTQAVIDFRL